MAPRPSAARNVLTNQASFVIGVATAFLTSPYIVSSLGDERYGVWTLCAALMGYYGLLDLGIRRAVGYFVASHSAREEHDELDRIASTAFWAMAGIGALIPLVGGGVALGFPGLFAGEVDPREVRYTILLLSLTVGLTLPLEALQAVLIGRSRFDLIAATDIALRIATAAGIVAVLAQGRGLVAMAWVNLFAKLAVSLLHVVWSRREVRKLTLSPRLFGRGDLKRLTGFGGPSLVAQGARLLARRGPLYLVGAFVSPASVAYYSFGRLMADYVYQLVNNAARVLNPRLVELHAQGRSGDLAELFLQGSRLCGLLAAAALASTAAFGGPFFRLWLGERFVSGDWSQRADIVLIGLLLAETPLVLGLVSLHAAYAAGRVRLPMLVGVGEAAALLALGVGLAPRFGSPGVLAAALLASPVAYGAVLLPLVLREVGVPGGRYLRRALGPVVVCGGLSLIAMLILIQQLPPLSWPLLIGEAAAAALFQAALVWGWGLTREERRAALRRLLDRSPGQRTLSASKHGL